MTNEEARSVLIKTNVICVSGKATEFEKAQRLAYQSLEENTKLKAYIARLNGELKSEKEWRYNARIELLDKKAEIEQLKWKLSSTETQRDLKEYDAKRNADIMSSQLKIIEQLKAELEQFKNIHKSSIVEIGMEVFVITQYGTHEKEIIKCKVNRKTLKSKITFSVNGLYKNFNCYNGTFTDSSIGKTIFLTREEAEQSLKGQV